MSASVMRGRDRAAGAVALMTRTRHPVAAAAALLGDAEVLLAGESAEAHAAANGLEQLDPDEFVTEPQRRRLAERLQTGGQTVGAVCLDETGLLAAATSTGGLHGQRPGRVGDSPLIGAGTWADGHVAVSCTGKGEAFIRAGAARLVAALVEHGHTLEAAAQAAMAGVAECAGEGGLIAVDASGNVTMPMSTGAMPRGVWRAGEGATACVP
jgi:isoaspartyl peptidase/L-asparaginase-like protein (Ntn-hydrolase superfamily)